MADLGPFTALALRILGQTIRALCKLHSGATSPYPPGYTGGYSSPMALGPYLNSHQSVWLLQTHWSSQPASTRALYAHTAGVLMEAVLPLMAADLARLHDSPYFTLLRESHAVSDDSVVFSDPPCLLERAIDSHLTSVLMRLMAILRCNVHAVTRLQVCPDSLKKV